MAGSAPGRSASGPGSSRNTPGSRLVGGPFRGSTQDATALAGLTVLLVLSAKTAERSSDRPVKGFARTVWAAAALGPSIEVVAKREVHAFEVAACPRPLPASDTPSGYPAVHRSLASITLSSSQTAILAKLSASCQPMPGFS